MTKQIKFKNLFVYGTLKEKGALHDHWLKDQTFMGTYYTEPNYFMFDYGPFPIVFPVKKGTGQTIEGEIFEVESKVFDRVSAMEEGAGYEVNQDVFLSKGGAIHRMASIYVYPAKFLKFDGEIKKGVVSWNNGTTSL
jgi:gamma-glutamylcyclotransferase (GGCT)/AIG2-like uncharacterized protein YtfP|tara:strand:- start:178 stop:588 length:411 start_codon:yes stop_codon:yes gene_type:complete